MSINSAAQFGINSTIDKSSGPSPMTRMGVQGEAPMTGLKGLGSMGISSGINPPHHLATRYSAPRSTSGGGMRGNAGSSAARLTISGGTGAGSGMRGGALGGGFGGNFGGGGSDFGKII